MAASALPQYVLLEDVNDLACFLEVTGRTIPRDVWADEAIRAIQDEQLEGLF
jgi:hypothetical protein